MYGVLLRVRYHWKVHLARVEQDVRDRRRDRHRDGAKYGPKIGKSLADELFAWCVANCATQAVATQSPSKALAVLESVFLFSQRMGHYQHFLRANNLLCFELCHSLFEHFVWSHQVNLSVG